MVARDDSGRFVTVTDPDVMNERLNAGAECYRLTAVAPHPQFMSQVMDRMFGAVRQTIDVDVTATPSSLTDGELASSLAALLVKLRPPAIVDLEPEI